MNSFQNTLIDLQNKEDDNISEFKIIGFIFVIIIAMIYIAKISFFNTIFLQKENNDFNYTKIAIYSLISWIVINFFVKYVF